MFEKFQKVFIPSAGLGTRLGNYTQHMNKALITVGDLPVIVRIINQFSKSTEFVIALGYHSEHIKEVIETLCDDKKITFKIIDKYDTENGSLGYTMLSCEEHLQDPFIFVSNDTIVNFNEFEEQLNEFDNWALYYEKLAEDGFLTSQYRTVEVNNGIVTDFNAKGLKGTNLYTGVCGISDYKKFWKMMKKSKSNIGEVIGLSHLDNIKAIKTNFWYDTGNLDSLKKAQVKFKSPLRSVLEKENEAIWFLNNKVYKFHVDENFISQRVRRYNSFDKKIVPKLNYYRRYIYSYNYEEGVVFSKVITPAKTSLLLSIVQESLWKNVDKNFNLKEVSNIIRDFYEVKTLERIEYYFKRFEKPDCEIIINDNNIPKARDLVSSINWKVFEKKAIFSDFHGDFHSENIIYTNRNEFKLIDWRQNFGEKNLRKGDVYYDLGKFMHGLLVSHFHVDSNNFNVKKKLENVIEINIYNNLNNFLSLFEFQKWCIRNNYDLGHIQITTAIIFLNICGLHSYPYSEFLFYLGLYLLHDYLNNGNNCLLAGSFNETIVG